MRLDRWFDYVSGHAWCESAYLNIKLFRSLLNSQILNLMDLKLHIFQVSERKYFETGTPYFHAFFHLLSSLAVYNVFFMFSLIDIYRRSDKHQYKYRIKHFPDKGLIRLSYIALNLYCRIDSGSFEIITDHRFGMNECFA
ncbi:Alkaline ceramidase [Dirofilaria immitis]